MNPAVAHIFLCDAERLDALRDELRVATGVQAAMAEGGEALIVAADAFELSGPPLTIAFARQTLPAAECLAEQSIASIVRRTTQLVIENCDNLANWSLHILRGSGPNAPGPNRVRVLGAEIENSLKKRRRRLLKTLRSDAEDHTTAVRDLPDHPGGDRAAPVVPQAIVQLYLESRECAWLSVFVPGRHPVFRRCVSPFPGGEWRGPEDRRPPSRAYRKLAEALRQFPWLYSPADSHDTGLAPLLRPGETCVDLGASPGGWSWLALEYGARVVAVDRSPLRADLMQHPRLRFVQGDAFSFRPAPGGAGKSNNGDPGRVDWLICDVIAFPARIQELLQDWLRNRRCRKFCVTVKFRGDEDCAALDEIKNMLNELAFDFAIRRLRENKNEATIFGTL